MAKKKKKEVDPNAPPPQKQSAGVYTMMLIASFIALVIGCVLLYFELDRYGFDFKPPKPIESSASQFEVVPTTLVASIDR